MSSKKKEKNDWSYCENCLCFYPRTIISKHSKLCGDDDTKSSDQLLDVASGFIKNNVFHGITKSYCEDTDGKLPNSKSDFILIHPTTIKACNLQVSSSVLLQYQTMNTYGTLWPSSSVQLDFICIASQKIQSLCAEEGQVLKIHSVQNPATVATSINLEVISNIDLNNHNILSEINLVLLDSLDITIVSTGDVISCMNHGDKISFKIHKINCKINRDADDEDIIDQLSKLNISVTDTNTETINVFPCVFMMNHTKIIINQKVNKLPTEKCIVDVKPTNDNIGGLDKQTELLDDLIKVPFDNPSIYSHCGIVMPKGIILYGPSGTGKTLLANWYVSKLDSVHVSTINGPELTSKYFGETEQKLRDIFKEAISKAPSVLLIDEFDTVCPQRTTSSNESEKRVVATLCTLLDSIPKDVLLVVIGITNKIEGIDPAVRRPGRFEKEIELNVPNVNERYQVLSKLINKLKHNIKDSDISDLAAVTHGYVGADLSALCKEAGGLAVKEFLKNKNNQCCSENLIISIKEFKDALCIVSPSALKAMTVDVPKVYWGDVGGQNEVKQKLKEAIEWPLKHPDSFIRLGIKPPRGLLMYGPPGCSKTMMAKALATESSLNFISIKGPELFNKYLGESERAVREVFRKARLSAPSIVFFDEIDALGVQRSGKDNGGSAGDRVLAQLLTELDGVESLDEVIIVAATNRPDIIDPALMRPGRIDRLIYVPLPDYQSRKEIFEIQFRKMPVLDVSVDLLVEHTQGFSGAEICSICHEAGLFALREDINSENVKASHFEAAINQISPGTSKETIEYYDNFALKSSNTK